ncbi:MAG: hypothetical protein ACRENP_22360 [Longimicrobiales bacterium]
MTRNGHFGKGMLLILAGVALVPRGSTLAAQTAADSVRVLDRAWGRAYAVYDTALAQSLFARDIIITNSVGALQTREQELTSGARPS